MRQKRKDELEEHVKAVNDALSSAVAGDSESQAVYEDESNNEWTGVSEDAEGGSPEAAPAVRPVDHEDEYIDEDKYTTVTVEEVGISRHGFDRAEDSSEDGSEGDALQTRADSGRASTKSQPSRTVSRQEEREGRLRKKRKKFKYESKADRKVTKAKERMKNSRAAKTRKG